MLDIAVKVENLCKIYKLYDKPINRMKEALSPKRKNFHKDHYALNNISFEVKKGETVGIVGTNGSGKSTLLKIITGVLSPSSGRVEVDGKISALLELGAGFNPEYTGIENIYLNGTMLGYSRNEIDEKIDAILKFADIGEFVKQPVKTYSSGMFVRLAFAVAINIEPEILIVDEALSVGDVFFQSKCYNKFEEFKKQGKTIILVTHDLGSVVRYCDRAILINEGCFIKEDRPKEIVDLYKKIVVNQFEVEQNGEAQKNEENSDTVPFWKDKLNINPSHSEYGNNFAEIKDFAVIDSKGNISNSLIKGEKFTIKMKIIFYEKITNPILAFTIRDVKGNDITGTNTMIEKIEVVVNKENELKEISFTQNLNLQGGEYLLCLGCTGYSKGEFTVYHRLYDICNVLVISEKNSVGFYDMNSVITLK